MAEARERKEREGGGRTATNWSSTSSAVAELRGRCRAAAALRQQFRPPGGARERVEWWGRGSGRWGGVVWRDLCSWRPRFIARRPVHGARGAGLVQGTVGRVRRVGARVATVSGCSGARGLCGGELGELEVVDGLGSGLAVDGTHGRRVPGGLGSLLGVVRAREGAGGW